MIEFQDYKTTDIPSVRYIDTGGPAKIVLKRSDPFGFWDVYLEKGMTPEPLKGHYTTFYEAEKAVQAYLQKNGKEIRSIK